MKVLHILASRGEGGLEKHTVDLVNGLAAKGVATGLVGDISLREKVASNVQFFDWDVSRSRMNPMLYLSLLKTIKAFNPDICHAQANKAGKVLSRIRSYIPFSKTIVTIHNIKKRLEFTGSLDAAIGVSDAVKTQLLNNYSCRIYNGIETSFVQFSKPEPIRSSDTLLCVGRLVEAKGFDILIKAIAQSNFRLNIIGDGPLKYDLEQLVKDLNISEKVKFLGHRDDVLSLMREALAVVISSRREGFSYVFSEALLSRTPVISTDVPVANEVLPQRMLCKRESIEALTDLLSRLDVNDPAYSGIFDFASEQFTLEAMVANTVSVYQELLKK